LQKRLSLLLITIVFGGILIWANSIGYLSGAKDTTNALTAPVSLFFSNFSGKTSGFFSGLLKLGSLQKENAGLRDQLNKLQAEVAQLSEDKKENERLKGLLGFVESGNYKYVPGEVISFDPSNVRGSITLNIGKKQGLKSGMAVISDGFLVGRIDEVQETQSKVRLITDPLSAIPAVLQNSNVSGIVKGEIGFGVNMEKIPQGSGIKVGDTVISSGLGGDFPRGLIVGKIEKINKLENSLFVDADVAPAASINNLSRVIVIKN
jgi:rod shape-determining protein MreC